MFARAESPETLHPEELDSFLSMGWFRMGQTIFTTNFLHFKGQFYSAIWLRIVLGDYGADERQKKIIKRNACFRTEIGPASITPEKEDLFTRYKQGISFEASASLSQLLFGGTTLSIYNTYEVTVYDGSKLIAAGYFDIGETSAAGITSFYDPAYKKHSLGKYLIYLKIEYCKRHNLQYFYPGYFVPGYRLFDYKLDIGRPALQYLQFASHQWLPVERFDQDTTPLQQMVERLAALQSALLHSNLHSIVLRYEFFDANLIPELRGADLFDFPLFLCFAKDINDSLNHLIVYDVSDGRYHLLKCTAVLKANVAEKSNDIYSAFVLKSEHDLFSTEKLNELVKLLRAEMKQQESTLM